MSLFHKAATRHLGSPITCCERGCHEAVAVAYEGGIGRCAEHAAGYPHGRIELGKVAAPGRVRLKDLCCRPGCDRRRVRRGRHCIKHQADALLAQPTRSLADLTGLDRSQPVRHTPGGPLRGCIQRTPTTTPTSTPPPPPAPESTVNAPSKKITPALPCIVPNCELVATAGAMCTAHASVLNRLRRARSEGRMLLRASRNRLIELMTMDTAQLAGIFSPEDLALMHSESAMSYPTCKVSGCERTSRDGVLCATCNTRAVRHRNRLGSGVPVEKLDTEVLRLRYGDDVVPAADAHSRADTIEMLEEPDALGESDGYVGGPVDLLLIDDANSGDGDAASRLQELLDATPVEALQAAESEGSGEDDSDKPIDLVESIRLAKARRALAMLQVAEADQLLRVLQQREQAGQLAEALDDRPELLITTLLMELHRTLRQDREVNVPTPLLQQLAGPLTVALSSAALQMQRYRDTGAWSDKDLDEREVV